MANTKWQIDEVSSNVHEIRFNNIESNWEQWVLLQSDEHWDNPYCNRSLLKRHHDEALERDAIIVKVGDLFCAMQGKWDKRSSKDDLRPEHRTGNYLDSLVQTAVDWYEPYKHNIALVTPGNHETSIVKRHESCLTTRFVERMRDRGGITFSGGYSGWLRFFFRRSNQRLSRRLWYHHGFGGGGPVTQGKIDWNRYGSYVEADIMVSGHVHYKECFPIIKMTLNDSSNIVKRKCYCVRLGTYKDEYSEGESGFHVEKGRGPRPLGGYWLRFYRRGHKILCSFIETEE